LIFYYSNIISNSSLKKCRFLAGFTDILSEMEKGFEIKASGIKFVERKVGVEYNERKG
jgi:hypothetical protein